MEVWKPQNSKQQQQVSHLSQRVQVKDESKPTGSKQQVKHTTSDSIRAIANVLNQHHNSKLLQQALAKKKVSLLEEQATKNNKLDQPVAEVAPVESLGDTHKCVELQKGGDNNNSTWSPSHDTCGATSSATATCSAHTETVYPPRRQSPSNQVDQSNSYLYAYNDFVTLHGHTCSRPEFVSQDYSSVDLNRVLDSSLSITDTGVHEQHLFCSQQQQQQQQQHHHLVPVSHAHHHLHHFQHHLHQHQHHNHQLEESLIDSEEDDALSYILHQHKLNHHEKHPQNLNCQTANQSLVSDFQVHQIDHHLSCARKSHPRHICGIGSSSPLEKQVNGGRLKERAHPNRKLVFKSAPTPATATQDFFESHKFTQDLTVLHNQLLHQQPHLHSQKHNLNQAPKADQHHRLESSASSAPPPPPPPPIKEGQQQQQQQQVNRLSTHKLVETLESSGSCESGSESARLTQERALAAANKAHQIHHQPGYLNWFLCRLTNFLPGSSATPLGASHTKPARQSRKSFAHELPVGPPPTARYQTTTTDHHHHHQQQQQQQLATSRQVILNEQLTSAGNMYSATPQTPAAAYYAGQAADVPCPNYTRHHHHHHYPISSESSLDSSGPFASSAIRLNALFRSLCSKKCLFVSCLALILLIFISVISLSAYLNFLINLNRTSLMPLSGRLKVDSKGDLFNEQLNNRSSPEYLDKQLQYETILRGAFDRTEWALKSYPNHLVKCEVYSFRPGSLWVYFRLFVNKRTLLLDQQLMRRRAYDEQMEQQFLPLLTQQTLHSGLRQLMQTGNLAPVTTTTAASSLDRRSARAAQFQQTRSPEARNSLSKRTDTELVPAKSFDDQISRLMPIITAIDLQTIEVSSDFDILRTKASSANLALQSPPVAPGGPTGSPFISSSSPATAQPDAALGSSRITEYDIGLAKLDLPFVPSLTANMSVVLAKAAAKQQASASSNGVTRVFTLFPGYRENITRPVTSVRPTSTSTTTTTDTVTTTDGWRQTSTESAVVRLESGQPVFSHNSRSTAAAPTSRNITLFGPFLRFDQSLIGAANNNSNNSRTTDTDRQRLANVTANSQQQQQQQMVAPYQQNNFFHLSALNPASNQNSPSNSSGITAFELASSHDVSIQDLWNNTIANKRNMTRVPVQLVESQQSSSAKRLITITTVDANNLHDTMAASNIDNRNKTPIPYEVSSTSTPSSTFSAPFVVSNPAQRVSPHLKQGGSIILLPVQRQHQQPVESTSLSSSAVLLSKDLPLQSVGQADSQLVGAASTNSSQQVANPHPTSGHGGALAFSEKPRRRPANGSDIGVQAKPISLLVQANSNGSANISRQLSMKEGKVKKVAEQISLLASVLPQTKNNETAASNGSLIKSKGIRIVDNYLASVAAANRTSNNGQLDPVESTGSPSSIELTRSVTGTRVVENHSNRPMIGSASASSTNGQPPVAATQPLDYTTTSPTILHHRFTSPSTISITENLVRLTTPANSFFGSSTDSLPNTRPTTPASGFSNHWKPIAATPTVSVALLDELLAAKSRPAITSNNNSIRKPGSASLIVGNEKLVQTINVPSTNQGSQSPFAMPASGLLDNLQSHRQPSGNRLVQPISEQVAPRGRPLPHKITTSTYRAPVQVVTASNEFESHRMSRMSHKQDHLFTSSEAISPQTPAKPVEIQLQDHSNATSHLPAALISGLQQVDLLVSTRVSGADSVATVRKTRGPFAFESLKTMEVFPQLSKDQHSDMSRVFPGRSLLTRKELTVEGNGNDEDAINSSSTMVPIVTLDEPDEVLMKTNASDTNTDNNTDAGNRTQSQQEADFGSRRVRGKKVKRLIRRQQKVSNGSNSSDTFRCQYYGCQAKGAEKFICLNYTQICDDFIDCQDESDELDCVSLLKLDSQTNRLSFSNGAGIIYLNRRGSLAPLCIDYYQTTSTPSDSLATPLDSAANSFESLQWNSSKRQQELIRQINTIGQYACRLQSFSRLVSVKINHNSLVDGLDLIKKSKLYHRLSIVEVPNGDEEEPIAGFATSGSQSLSANMKHGVAVSTSSECPSQRTAFVKCGGFECGQDSTLSLTTNKATPSKPRDGLIINDFPWLVKLYWKGSLSCHGYLIDDLWLISSGQCLGHKSTSGIHNVHDWTAEISHEHYGLDDYQSIETNRRNIKSILLQPLQDNAASSFVLAKLEKPVRFSPLNRPICLPMNSPSSNNTADFARHNKECVTVTLPGADSQIKQDLVLKKVKVVNPRDCHKGNTDALICVSEGGNISGSQSPTQTSDSARVLICSVAQAPRNRSKWTLVGVQMNHRTKDSNKLLFSTISNQMSWIVDTMNPKFHLNSITLETRDPKPPVGDLLIQQSSNNSTQQVCNNFKCSSGECLSWSRICDGLYDCSSHEDEKDCHK